ncbi:MAG: corrinoid protein [Alphaproteobacteria bacterium]|jgi:5-methyltetrahydrofolate--homocysteine methyltransferase|nr:corrinoid protein [Alphaproteobacteria bacterium]MDP6253207.1 corrinoid protein [Alphaproteobacteria bacterium]MDP7056733.1 corrinoid protein [Alphaproteobacteria bacterium]MDP7228112.1 corrinoid protein [Alphaproteobacteria bacterium]MDP7461262.1 corrinoid protein [Alphaproteobacteria bacterium]|tara:strand:+ start:1647 stop:2285 length:639 start_codon:yes stop_codon:yes gene_type:complete
MSVAEIFDAVMEYEEEDVAALVQAEIDAGTGVKKILQDGLIAPLDVIGEKFSAGTLFVPEMLMAAEAVQAGLDILRPLLTETGVKPIGTVVLGTVKGDLHDIGKNLVGLLLEGAGFRVIDLGTDVDGEQFISAAQENEADIIALSGLLTTSMPEMEKAVATVQDANTNRNLNVKVMIGGPPVHHEFAMTIGADAYGMDAPAAVEQAREFVTG